MLNIINIGNTKCIYFIGDIHGNYSSIQYFVNNYNVRDAALFLCGDCGFGFEKHEYYRQAFNKLSRVLSKRNCHVIFIRGNHDDPAYFDGKAVNYKWIKAVPDYTVVRVNNDEGVTLHAVLCVGGAISIDRKYRNKVLMKNAMTYMKYHDCTLDEAIVRCKQVYWENERCVYDEIALDGIHEANIQVDVVATHTCPSFCQPHDKIGIKEWLLVDEELESDVTEERTVMDKVLEKLKNDGHPVRYWFYGHYHFHNNEEIDGVKYRMLDMERYSNVDAFRMD